MVEHLTHMAVGEATDTGKSRPGSSNLVGRLHETVGMVHVVRVHSQVILLVANEVGDLAGQCKAPSSRLREAGPDR